MTGLDPRHPMVFDARVLGRRAGAMVQERRVIPVTDGVGQIGTDVVAVVPGAELDVDLRLESVLEGVLASGAVGSVAEGTCVRCLEPVRLPVSATFQELFAYADRAAHHHQVGAQDDEEAHVLVGDLLNLEPVLRDAIVPALPFQPVCRPDCPGLCDQCGQPLDADPGHVHEDVDPRWAALAGLAAASDTSPQTGPSGPGNQEKRN
ncbi:MAG: DUF177 domain-containing protein [Austwickia sp.]|jgi:uncharacterized protein|nr:DUF177 domain-containing protein [Austwickia sp.]MBK8436951.1 DUF177 domain-containing protein [Austwickia sp.]MBK9100578.1 DUF177 domain-containing protein [Austwickia sp.]